jgi:hypothetical protein
LSLLAKIETPNVNYTMTTIPTAADLTAVLSKLDAGMPDSATLARMAIAGGLASLEPTQAPNNSPELDATQPPVNPEDLMLPPPGTDMSKLTTEEISKYIGQVRAMRIQRQMKANQHVPVEEKPRVEPARIEKRVTTSRNAQWCKMSPDGFTPLRRQPTMQLQQEYDAVIATPTQRTWTFRDPFRPTDPRGADITEKWTVIYPCSKLETVARDITRAWQLYSTPDLPPVDSMLLANTPLAVEVDNITSLRYSDLWCQLRHIRGKPLPPSTKWRVVRRGGQEVITSN